MGATAIYVRISKDKTGERAGVERQREDCEALARNLGLTDLRIYDRDNDVSAFSRKPRPDFERLMADIEAGEIGAVLVWAVDRLYRRLTDLERIVTVFDTHAVTVHAVKSGDIDLSTADGRLHARLLGSVAQHESEKKSERIKRESEQRAKKGILVSSQRPFGWRHAEDGGLEPDPLEAPALAQAYQDVADGRTLRATWKRLGATVDVGKMAPATLGKILRNPRNAGLSTYLGEVVAEAADGQRIVDRDLFDRVAAILSDPTRRTSPGRPANTWLGGGGLLSCGVCGKSAAAGGRLADGGVYVCSHGWHVRRRRHLIDTPVLSVVGEVLARLGARGLLAQSAPADDAENHARRVRIADAERTLDALASQLAAGQLRPEAYAKATNKIIAGMDADMEALTVHAGRPAVAKLASSGDVAATWRGWLDAGNRDAARAVMTELIDRVTLNTDRTVTIAWNADLGLEPITLDAPEPTIGGRAERRQRVADLHSQGMKISAIAAELGCDRATVRADLKVQGMYEQSA